MKHHETTLGTTELRDCRGFYIYTYICIYIYRPLGYIYIYMLHYIYRHSLCSLRQDTWQNTFWFQARIVSLHGVGSVQGKLTEFAQRRTSKPGSMGSRTLNYTLTYCRLTIYRQEFYTRLFRHVTFISLLSVDTKATSRSAGRAGAGDHPGPG